MGRIEHSLTSSEEPITNCNFRVECGLFSTPSGDNHCTLFAPLHYEPGYAYPLIVWLHGEGFDERQLMKVMPLVSMRNYAAVAPRGTCFLGYGEENRTGYGWQQSDEQIAEAQQKIFDGIEAAEKKFHVDPRRVFLVGFDSGGTMAFRVATNHPQRFAGVMSLCGAFPTDRTPLGNLNAARRLPMFLAVGRDAQQYPASAVCDALRLFHTAGMSLTLRQYPCGHQLAPQMLRDVDRWIIEQITAVEDSLASSG